ncbi:MAG: glycosyl hydrolase 2 galactose-binding domain-containing protein, partial [Candidatus Hodarchaeales archaeon]
RSIIELEKWKFAIVKSDKLTEIKNKIPEITYDDKLSQLDIEFRQFNVPGTLHSNLAELENLDPYFEKNMDYFNSLENDGLLLVCKLPSLELNKDYILRFQWIDTNADVYLNGKKIGSSDNAFIEKIILIPKNILLNSSNLLMVLLYPHMMFVDEDIDLPLHNPADRIFVRRPAYNYGWDFGVRALVLGVGSVTIEDREECIIKNIFVYTRNITETKADLSIYWETKCEEPFDTDILIEISIKDQSNLLFKKTVNFEINKGLTKHHIDISILEPRLWWPNGYGEQNLYRIRITELSKNISEESIFGIRTVKLLLEEGQKKVFIFKINGVKVWAKGANWVPTDALNNFSEESKYRKLLEMARSANFNMIRVWGGGVVEKEEFYSICDELGIMLWHDFQFACSVYPETKEYLENVDKEIRSIILRLRNHPSIVLWNGNNENEWIDFQHFTPSYRKESGLGEKLHYLKQKAWKELDPSRPYWKSSPWSPSSETDYEFDPNSPEEGNRHNWEVWHGMNQPNLEPPEYEHYFNEHGKFISEFGIQSLPDRSTIDQIFSSETQQQPNDVWEFHNCIFHKIEPNLRKIGKPKNIDDWVLFTQAAQAFGMKYAIDIWRTRKWDMAGSLIWQFNEPWPTICWSLIDYYNNPKMSYWFVKRAFNPIHPVFDTNNNTVTVINDTLSKVQGKLTLKEYSTLSEKIKESRYNIDVEANSKASFHFEAHPESEIVYLSFEDQDFKYDNFSLLKDPSKLQIPEPELKVKFDDRRNRLVIWSKGLAFIAQIDSSLEPEDNFLTIFPDNTIEINITKPPKNKKCLIKVW